MTRIVFQDDFAEGLNGGGRLVGNYEEPLETVLPPYLQWTGPMLSSAGGCYAMKLATRERAGAVSFALKRLTHRIRGLARLDLSFALGSEFRAFAFGCEVQNAGGRAQLAVRLEQQQGWQLKRWMPSAHPVGPSGETESCYLYSDDGWSPVADGRQRLAVDSTDELTWHYAAFEFDPAAQRYLQLRCNDRCFDLGAMQPKAGPPSPWLDGMIHPFVCVEADAARRTSLYIHSALLSIEEL